MSRLPKFKTGQTVIRTGPSLPALGIFKGHEYQVKEQSEDGYHVYLLGYNVPLESDYFELVSTPHQNSTPQDAVDEVEKDIESLRTMRELAKRFGYKLVKE